MSTLTLFYWRMKARSYAPAVIAKAGGLDLKMETNFDLAELKASGNLAFGQLPYLEDGDIKVVQSGAVLRYISRKANLMGETDADFAMSEVLIEEMQSITTLFNQAMYGPEGKTVGFDKLFAADGEMAKQLTFLETLLKGDTFCSKPLAGDYSMAAILDIGVCLEPSLLDNYPKLKSFHSRLVATSAFDDVRDWPLYHKRA